MKLSYNWLREYIDLDIPIEELVEVLTYIGLEVEEVIDNKAKYNGFFTAHVLEIVPHPDADKLRLCTVQSVNGEQTVVCGAPNVEVGQNVILGTEGAVVPSAGFVLSKRKIRGVESNGMICSQSELELGEDSDGIWVLPEDVKPGQPISEYLGLNDTTFEIAITPNKGDCLSHYGIARDLGAYFRKKVKKPDFDIVENGESVSNSIAIEIENDEACPRYAARIVRGVKVQESPKWLKQRLTSIGLRPINNVVDITNFVLMELGQPLHAFDYNLVAGNKIIVKNAAAKQEFTTLDEKKRILDSDMLMICDSEKPIAVAGVMGGVNSEINDNTTDVLIESAYFSPNSVRSTAKKLGITSDASYRFERGVDIDSVELAADRCAYLLQKYANGVIEKGIVDVYKSAKEKVKVSLRFQRVEKITGLKLANEEIKEILTSLNFVVISESSESIEFEIPNYRHDIQDEIDLVEEVVRIYNYDKLTPQFFAKISFDSRPLPSGLRLPPLRNKIREYLINNGFNESLTQNQIDPESAALFTDTPLVVSNPLGRELSIMRPSLLPSMLRVVSRNIRLGTSDLQLFEVGKIFETRDNDSNLVKGVVERENLLVVLSGNKFTNNWDVKNRKVNFYDIKGLLQSIVEFIKLNNLKLDQNVETGFGANSCQIMLDSTKIGVVGEIERKLLKKYDIDQPVMALLFDMTELYKVPEKQSRYNKVSPFPSISRDLAFIVPEELEAGKISSLIESNGGKYFKSVDVFDVYKGDNIDKGKKSVAYSLEFISSERTLTDSDIDKVIKNLVKNIESTFKAELRKN
ncbi:MAG: phenylalanine--tRNA ligase subunit beta [Ignavibacteriae bacterium]|nr:phenylalanine--tRNA ligase subunit beta [Ignavibacteriota bacterium]MCB9221452.1 phenylalanine--tRNA ligase subunit beta [Ignavibacteria bacterium]